MPPSACSPHGRWRVYPGEPYPPPARASVGALSGWWRPVWTSCVAGVFQMARERVQMAPHAVQLSLASHPLVASDPCTSEPDGRSTTTDHDRRVPTRVLAVAFEEKE
jgi:hypothetical protein